jgi:hypothetical protein
MTRRFACAVLLAAIGGAPPLSAQQSTIDPALAARYFAEVRALAVADNGDLWGVPLAGPMVMVDSTTRDAVANQADSLGVLKKVGDVYAGTWPEDTPVANTAFDWAGERWAIVVWPLPEDPVTRGSLLIHELFHRVQPELGLPTGDPLNTHLDEPDGRIWIQLEWRALAVALNARGKDRERALVDALTFREQRRARFPTAAASENALELHEGLAEYTGIRLGGGVANAEQTVADRLRTVDSGESLVRSSAYRSGPAYGLLLDATGEVWRSRLRPSHDLGRLLQRALDLRLPGDIVSAALPRSAHYDGKALMKVERARAEARATRLQEVRTQYVRGHILEIPVAGSFTFTFDPGNLISLGDFGTLYPNATISDVWGRLVVTDGVLIDFTRGRVVVPAPESIDARPLKGPGWTLELEPGWTFQETDRAGTYRLITEGM